MIYFIYIPKFNLIKNLVYILNFVNNLKSLLCWGLGIGDWGLGIGDWAQTANPQSPIPNPHSAK